MATINSKLNETVELVKGKTSKPLVLSEQQKNEFKSLRKDDLIKYYSFDYIFH